MLLPDSSDASFTVNGIVMPGMKPLMASCLINTSLRAGSMPTICPRSSYCLAGGSRLHATSSVTTARETIRRRIRIHSSTAFALCATARAIARICSHPRRSAFSADLLRNDLMEPALRLQRLTKTFGATRAVDELDLVVPRGATYGFIGPSGAGKTTCIRMIMAILFPDSGELSVLGHRSALEAKDRIGYLPEERGVYRRMRVGDFLTYIAQLKGVSAEEALPRAKELLARTGLVDIEKKRCEELSKGMLHRVEFVAAIINRPELIILDEPFSGLDPVSVKLLKELVAAEQRRGATILFSTHIMAHAEELCQHVVMIHRGPQGARRADGRPAAPVRSARPSTSSRSTRPARLRALRQMPGVADVTADGGRLRRCTCRRAPTRRRRCSRSRRPFRSRSIALARLRLEDVFLRLVAADAQGTEAERALRANLQGVGAEGALA